MLMRRRRLAAWSGANLLPQLWTDVVRLASLFRSESAEGLENDFADSEHVNEARVAILARHNRTGEQSKARAEFRDGQLDIELE